MEILLAVITGILLLAAVMLVRAWMLKPTAAKTAAVQLDGSERAAEYGHILSRMVQKETVSWRGQEDRTKFWEFHQLLEELFPHVHAVCEKHVFNGSLLFQWKGNPKRTKKDPILFMSHQDVVEANGQWKQEPFGGEIDESGRVWGRGTVDTKASLFCIFKAVDELIAEGFEPEFDVYIASSCTEEWSGEGAPLTARYLQEQGVRLRFLLDEGGMVVQDPIAGVKGTYAMVGVLEKGYGDVKFTARSKGGHASAPGRNTPLVRLGKFMAHVEKNNPFSAQYTPVVAEMFRRLAPNMDFGMRLIFANLWLFRPLVLRLLPVISPVAGAMMRTTLAFTMAKGSDGANVLPQEASVIGNMRFIHHQSNAESIACISRIAEKYGIETQVIHQDDPCPIADFSGEAFRLAEEVIHQVYPGVGVSPYVMTGATDAKYYSQICGNCLRFAPLYIDGQQFASIHGLDENIFQGTLPKGVDFYKMLIRKS